MRRSGAAWAVGLLLAGATARAAPAGLSAEVEVLRAKWGSGPGELGRSRPSEANPECPSSFFVDEAGTPWILDQLNARVAVFGARFRSLPARETAGDLAPGLRGGVVLLDRKEGAALVVDTDGRLVSATSALGPATPEPGGFTAILRAADGWWVEYDNRVSLRVLDSQGRPDPARPVIEGRPSPDGLRAVAAARDGRQRVALRTGPLGGALKAGAAVQFVLPVEQILALDPLPDGGALLAAWLRQTRLRTGETREEVDVVALGPRGQERWRRRLAAAQGVEEQLRPVRLGLDGKVYRLVCAPDAAVLRRVP